LWIRLEGVSSWSHFPWDIGLVAIRPDRMSLAVLAATDTD
jgi:hypothetical protein